jgi:arylsulfatase A-like enzyme
MVDKQVQQVLDAVKSSGQEENTLIVFSSDHGDMDASHRLESKNTLYEESANIPLLVMWKGHLEAGKVDSSHLVSNGLDLLPTFCDYAGMLCLSDSRGRSLRPLLEGRDVHWRQTLGVDSQIGSMVVSEDGYKYTRYDFDGVEEQLLDLNKDPHEKTHFTNSKEHKGKLDKMRNAFQDEWFPIKK